MLKNAFLLALLFFVCLTLNSQVLNQDNKLLELEERISKLEKENKDQGEFLNYLYSNVEILTYRTVLSLTLNRNFTYNATIVEGENITLPDGKLKKVYMFSGFRSFKNFDNDLNLNRTLQLQIIRGNLQAIKNTVVDYDPFNYEGKPKNKLLIYYYDNSEGDSPYIIADTELNSLKVRINGIMTEVGWE